MLPVLQWPEDGNNLRNPRQMSLSCLGGAFLFMVEIKNKLLLLFVLFCVACSDMGTNPKEEEIPEAKICRELNIEMRDGLGEKIRSSSELIKNNNEN